MMWPNRLPLKFCLLNAENLFLLFDEVPGSEALRGTEEQWQKRSSSVYENKPLRKCHELARAVNAISPDILMLCEVGGFESLKNFNELFLGSAYSPVLLEGNSDRNIDVGFLIRRSPPYSFDFASNKNRPINYLYPHERQSLEAGLPVKTASHRFSRDAVELKLYQQSREKPFLIILLTHLKSRLDRDRVDPYGFERRQAEMRTLLEIYGELKQTHPQTPVIVCGDFNGNAGLSGTDEEFRRLYEITKLQDVLEIQNVPAALRATYYQIRNGGRADGRQIDYCFLEPELTAFLKPGSASVYRYLDHLGFPFGPPQSMEAKLALPSDHYPLVFELENLHSW